MADNPHMGEERTTQEVPRRPTQRVVARLVVWHLSFSLQQPWLSSLGCYSSAPTRTLTTTTTITSTTSRIRTSLSLWCVCVRNTQNAGAMTTTTARTTSRCSTVRSLRIQALCASWMSTARRRSMSTVPCLMAPRLQKVVRPR